MRPLNGYDASLDRRVREIGHQIFETAADACPRIWERAWVLEKLTSWVDSDPRLKAASFDFVATLPSLRDNRDIARHLAEFMQEREVDLPWPARWALSPRANGSMLANVIGQVARRGADAMSERFITGHDVQSVTATLERFRRQDMTFTLDVLGESTTSDSVADRYLQVYLDLVEHLCPRAASWDEVPRLDQTDRGRQPRVNISIKLTGLDPHFDPVDPGRSIEEVSARITPLLRRARELGAFVNIDMEAFRYRDLTLDLFERLMMRSEFRDWEDVGIVVQAYLNDGERDLQRLLTWGRRREHRFAIRLVKGAYWDTEVALAEEAGVTPPVWRRKWQSDACFERMTRVMLAHTDVIRPCFASHNVRSLAHVLGSAQHFGLSSRAYEVQMLYGMGDPLKHAMVTMGQCLRIYSPYGDMIRGMAYLIRRLIENTSNDSFLKQGFRHRASYGRLLSDPAVHGRVEPPSDACSEDEPGDESPGATLVAPADFGRPETRAVMTAALNAADPVPTFMPYASGRFLSATAFENAADPSRAGSSVARIGLAGAEDVDSAVAAARPAALAWRRIDIRARRDALARLGGALVTQRAELAAWLIRDAGMTWRAADLEIIEAVKACRAGVTHAGDDHPASPGVWATLLPWNAPLSAAAQAVAVGLVNGHAVVLKPDMRAACAPAAFAALIHALDLPAGLVSVLPGVDPALTGHLARNPDVDRLLCLGPPEPERLVRDDRGTGRVVQRMQVPDAVVVVSHTANIDAAVSGAIVSAFDYAGQGVRAAKRIFVDESILSVFLERLKEAAESLMIGEAFAPLTLVGPMIDESARARLRRHIDRALPGMEVLVDRQAAAGVPEGCVGPLVVCDATRLAEPVIGPVAQVCRFAEFEQALRRANARPCQAAAVFSRTPSQIRAARAHLTTGSIFINAPIAGSGARDGEGTDSGPIAPGCSSPREAAVDDTSRPVQPASATPAGVL